VFKQIFLLLLLALCGQAFADVEYPATSELHDGGVGQVVTRVSNEHKLTKGYSDRNILNVSSGTTLVSIYPGLKNILDKIKEQNNKKTLTHTPAMGKLSVTVTPAHARIRIMNIAPKYTPMMELVVGRFYDIEVDAPGYETAKKTIRLKKQINKVTIVLKTVSSTGNTSTSGAQGAKTYKSVAVPNIGTLQFDKRLNYLSPKSFWVNLGKNIAFEYRNSGADNAVFLDIQESLKSGSSNSNFITTLVPGTKIVVFGLASAQNNRFYFISWGKDLYGWSTLRNTAKLLGFGKPYAKWATQIADNKYLFKTPGEEARLTTDWRSPFGVVSKSEDYKNYTTESMQNNNKLYTGNNVRLLLNDDGPNYRERLVRFSWPGHASYLGFIPKENIVSLSTLKNHNARRATFFKIFIGVVSLYVVLLILLFRFGQDILSTASGALMEDKDGNIRPWGAIVVGVISAFIAFLVLKNIFTILDLSPGFIFYETIPLWGIILSLPIFVLIPLFIYTVQIYADVDRSSNVMRENTIFTPDGSTADRQFDNLKTFFDDERVAPGMATRAENKKAEELKEHLRKKREAAEEFNRADAAQRESVARAKYAEAKK